MVGSFNLLLAFGPECLTMFDDGSHQELPFQSVSRLHRLLPASKGEVRWVLKSVLADVYFDPTHVQWWPWVQAFDVIPVHRQTTTHVIWSVEDISLAFLMEC